MIHKFTNVPVATYQDHLTYGPVYTNFNDHVQLHHWRSDHPEQVEPVVDTNNLKVVDQPLCWGGVIHGHFGHMLTEYGSRFVQYRELVKQTGAKICMVVKPRNKRKVLKEGLLPAPFKDLIKFYGYSAEDIYVVHGENICASELYSVSEAETLNQRHHTDEQYLNLLDQNNPTLETDHGNMYYVSRSKMNIYSGRYSGERYVEQYLEHHGFKTIHPQLLSYKEQIDLYNNANKLIFCEGSAVFGTLPLGRMDCDTLIIRRKNFPFRRFGYFQLHGRMNSLNYISLGDGDYMVKPEGHHFEDKTADSCLGVPCTGFIRSLNQWLNSVSVDIKSDAYDECSFVNCIENDLDLYYNNT